MSIKHPFLIIALAGFLITACGSDPSTNGEATKQENQEASTDDSKTGEAAANSDAGQEMTEGETAGITPEAFNNSLKKLALGKWKNEASPTQTIEFTETKYRRFNNNQLEAEADYVIDNSCAASNCTIQGQKLYGWCFMLKENGANNCYVVTAINAVNMAVTMPSQAGSAINYIRITAEK